MVVFANYIVSGVHIQADRWCISINGLYYHIVMAVSHYVGQNG